MENAANVRAELENVVELRREWVPAHPRRIAAEDWDRFRGYIGEIFGALGMDLDTPGTEETPERFLNALYDATSGYDGDPKLKTAFPAEHGAVRAPLSALPRLRPRRLHRGRADHRHLEADAARPAVRAPLHGAGAAR